jgi:hypothetical protein
MLAESLSLAPNPLAELVPLPQLYSLGTMFYDTVADQFVGDDKVAVMGQHTVGIAGRRLQVAPFADRAAYANYSEDYANVWTSLDQA